MKVLIPEDTIHVTKDMIPKNVTEIIIPNSVTSIGNYAFDDCTGLTSITIPNSVTSIGEQAFSWCTGLTSITIPSSVESIGDGAFNCCFGLTSITIPNSVTNIGEWAFMNCTGLTSINVEQNNEFYESKGNCLIEKSSKTLIAGCKNSVIPTDGSVTSIGDSAFYGCTGLTSITIPDSVTSIGNYAFFGCTGLTSITIPNSVTSIGKGAFWGCSGLKKIGKWKATSSSIKCRDFQYCMGRNYNTSDVKLCENGFHYCEDAFDLFTYYYGKIGKDVRFFEVEVNGVSIEKGMDSKRVCTDIKLVREITSYAELLN